MMWWWWGWRFGGFAWGIDIVFSWKWEFPGFFSKNINGLMVCNRLLGGLCWYITFFHRKMDMDMDMGLSKYALNSF